MLPDENLVRIERMPTDGDSGAGWDIIRAAADHQLALTVVSTDLFGIRTHYHRGRTGPCLKAGCEACEEGKLSRWHGYLFAVRSSNSERVIFEFTPPCASTFDAAFREYGKLRGLNVIVSRTSNRANAKVVVVIKGPSPNAHKLPREPLMWPTLSKIWGLRSESFPEFEDFSNHPEEPPQENQASGFSVESMSRELLSRERSLELAGQLHFPLNGEGKK